MVFYRKLLNAHFIERTWLRFFMYSGDRDEPPHVHVEKQGNEVKFWLSPINLAKNTNRRFNHKELKEIREILENNQSLLITKWTEFFYGTDS